MLDRDALRATDDGFELDVHLNWYRSLPLSSVKTIELRVNGEAIPREQIAFELAGREYALADLAARWDETWFVLDAATLRATGPRLTAGETAEVVLTLGSRIPYILVGPGQPLEYVSERAARLVVR